jgi:hypothetical protein
VSNVKGFDQEFDRLSNILPDDFQIVITRRSDDRFYQIVLNDPDEVIDPETDGVEAFTECGGFVVLGRGFRLSVALHAAEVEWERLLVLHPKLGDRMST